MARFVGRLAATLVCTTFVTIQFPTPLGQAQLLPQDISVYAQKITVRIDGQKEGSGFIIEKSGNTYTVLTNWHVVNETGTYSVTTVDGQKYSVNYRSVQQLPGLDLARLQFESSRSYEQADFGNSDEISPGQQVFFAGYPQEIRGERGRNYTFQAVSIRRILSTPNSQGYALVYNGEALPGMSGGPVLNSNNSVIGVHGEANVHSGTTAVSLYAIPINIARSKLDNLPSPVIAESPVLERRNDTPPAPENNIELSVLEREIIAEMNRVRTNPKAYANELARLRQYYDGKDLTIPGRATIPTEEGVEALDEAIEFLRSTNPLPRLRFSAGLSMAATDHAQDQSSTVRISHTGNDGSNLTQRVNRYGRALISVAQSINYTEETAKDIIRSLIVSDGLSGRGDRRAIFSSNFKFTVVGCNNHTIYDNICVVVYARGFTESRASRTRSNSTTSATETETNTERETAETTTEENVISLNVNNVLRLPLRKNGVLEEGDKQLPRDRSFYDTYAFAGNAGQEINISLESRDFDTYIMFIDPEYKQIAENDDISQENRNSAISIRLPKSGTYVVIVNAVDASGRGRYTLTVNER